MNRYRWQIVLAAALMSISALIYIAQVVIFHKSGDTFFYMLQDLAFLPVQVLLVTLVVNELMKERERSILKHKMNMVIGAFFTEMGNELLRKLLVMDEHPTDMRQSLIFTPNWNARDFQTAKRLISERKYRIRLQPNDLLKLREYMLEERGFLLSLLENPNLLEHESFTELLWAFCHLLEELHHRTDFSNVPNADIAHLEGDVVRCYRALLGEWLSYVEHLKDQYPFMFSLVVRTNPFDPQAQVELAEAR